MIDIIGFASRGLMFIAADANASERWQKPDRRHTRNVLDFRLEQMQNVTQETGVRAVQGFNRNGQWPNTG